MSKYISVEDEVSRKVLVARNEGFLSSIATNENAVKTPNKKSKKKK